MSKTEVIEEKSRRMDDRLKRHYKAERSIYTDPSNYVKMRKLLTNLCTLAKITVVPDKEYQDHPLWFPNHRLPKRELEVVIARRLLANEPKTISNQAQLYHTAHKMHKALVDLYNLDAAVFSGIGSYCSEPARKTLSLASRFLQNLNQNGCWIDEYSSYQEVTKND